MRLRAVLALALALTLGLGTCDEPETVISHVDRRGGFSRNDLLRMQDQRGIPVEIHGSPFRSVSDRELVEAVRPPGGAAQTIAFYARPPGGWMQGHPSYLVLHFSPQGGPNSVADCQRTAEARTNPPREGGFTVTATFCEGDVWQARGHLEALNVEDGDVEAFSDMMAQLMQAIFREEKDR